MNILCLSRSSAAFKELQTYAINLIIVDSIAALMDTLTQVKCSGIILDIKSLMRTQEHHKCLLYEFIDAFPTLRVNSSRDGDSFVPLGDPDEFITRNCATFSPRRVRKDKRLRLQLQLLLARGNDPEMRAAVKTCSIDVSGSGMFVFTSDDWHPEEQAWIRITELADPDAHPSHGPLGAALGYAHEFFPVSGQPLTKSRRINMKNSAMNTCCARLMPNECLSLKSPVWTALSNRNGLKRTRSLQKTTNRDLSRQERRTK